MKKKQIQRKITDLRNYENMRHQQYRLNLPPQSKQLKDYYLNNYRKESLEYGLGYHETHSQNFNNVYRSYINSVDEQKQQSQCPSIQNAMFQGFLGDLSNLQDQIKIKSNTIAVLENLVKATEEQMNIIKRQNESLILKLEQSKKRVQQLQLELKTPKINRFEGSSAKKSITRTYTTEKNILSNQSAPSQPIQLISAQIFNQFAVSYESLIQQLQNWVQREQQQQTNNGMFTKINSHCIQIQEFLYGKSDQQYSKSTYETLHNQNKLFLNVPTQQTKKSTTFSSMAQNQYEYIISVYKQHCERQSALLFQSINYIQNLTKTFQNSRSSYLKNSTLPPQLIKIVIKECNKIIHNAFGELKKQNLQLVTIMNEMIQWIQKNCKNGNQILKSWGSSMY